MVDDRAVRFNTPPPPPRPLPGKLPGPIALAPAVRAYGPSGNRNSRGAQQAVTRMAATRPKSSGNPPVTPSAASSSQASPAPARVSPPSPMRDVDWFNADALFRADRRGLANTLQETLSQILFDKQTGYRNVENQIADWTKSRNQNTEMLGEDFASRGLASSGLYKQGLDSLMADYEKKRNVLGSQEQDLAQQYGARGSLSNVNAEGLYDTDYNALANIYGLLGARGTSAGSQYGSALNQARATSASRSNRQITNTLGY